MVFDILLPGLPDNSYRQESELVLLTIRHIACALNCSWFRVYLYEGRALRRQTHPLASFQNGTRF